MNWIRDLSLILLAVEAFVVALIPLVLCGGLVYGLWWLQRRENLPRWLKLAQAYLAQGRYYVEMAMRAVVGPILLIHSIAATVQNWLGTIGKFAKER